MEAGEMLIRDWAVTSPTMRIAKSRLVFDAARFCLNGGGATELRKYLLRYSESYTYQMCRSFILGFSPKFNDGQKKIIIDWVSKFKLDELIVDQLNPQSKVVTVANMELHHAGEKLFPAAVGDTKIGDLSMVDTLRELVHAAGEQLRLMTAEKNMTMAYRKEIMQQFNMFTQLRKDLLAEQYDSELSKTRSQAIVDMGKIAVWHIPYEKIPAYLKDIEAYEKNGRLPTPRTRFSI